MLVDGLLLFDPANTAVTVSAPSTNVLDGEGTGVPASPQGRDLGPGRKLTARIAIQQTFTAAGAATLTVQLQAAPDVAGAPGTWAILSQSDAIPKAALVAGAFIELPLGPQPPQAENLPPEESGPPRFYRLNYVVATGPFTAGQLQSFLTDGDTDNPIAYAANYKVS